MSDITEFLLARVAEDEQGARRALLFGHPDDATKYKTVFDTWHVRRQDERRLVIEAHLGANRPRSVVSGYPLTDDALFDHIARWDPARVLAECEAKRRIISDYQRYVAERRRAMGGWDTEGDSTVMKALALPYADHLDYRQEWRP